MIAQPGRDNERSADSSNPLRELKRVGALSFRLGNEIPVEQVTALLSATPLAERRPLEDRVRMSTVMANSNLVVSAWDRAELIGLARSITDFGMTTYLADLAVAPSHQGRGIGRELIELTREIGGPQTKILLLAAPSAEGYYPQHGFTLHPQAWILRPEAG